MDAIHRIVLKKLRLVGDVRNIIPSEQETLNTPLLGKDSRLYSVKQIMLIFARLDTNKQRASCVAQP